MMKRILTILTILIVLLTGCWDKVELDMRTFVLGAAADVAPLDDEFKGREFVKKDKPDLYMLTLEMPVSKLMAAKGGGGGGGGGSQQQTKPTLVNAGTGTSFFEIIRHMATESDKVLYFGHQRVLIIGEELARRYDLNKVVDVWARDSEAVRSIKVLIAQGRAKDIFNAQPKLSQSACL